LRVVVALFGFTGSFRYAVKGFLYALRTQRNMRVHFIAAALALILSFAFHFTSIELLIVFFAITFVIMAEMLNTAFETMVDAFTPKYHFLAGVAKDVAAGAVLMTALNSLAVAAFLFLPHILPVLTNERGALIAVLVLPAGILAGILPVTMVRISHRQQGNLEILQQEGRCLEQKRGKISTKEAKKHESNSTSRKEWQKLLEKAKEARRYAYAPYSGYVVGAALISGRGKIYTGCNVENASYGLSMCAERVAVFKAVAAGERDIKAIAIVGENDDFCFPCGACRQVLAEFCRRDATGENVADCVNGHNDCDMKVIISNSRGDIIVRQLSELLPDTFSLQKGGCR